MTDEPRDAHPDEAALQRYADGEMDPAGDSGLAAHIEECAACREHVARVQRVTAFLALGSAAPDTLRRRIEARRARPRTRRATLAVGSLAAAALLGVVLMRDGPREQDVDAATKGAKSATPAAVVFATTLREWRQAGVDSVLAALNEPRSRAEVTHSARSQALADSVISYLVRSGVLRERVTATPREGEGVAISVFRQLP